MWTADIDSPRAQFIPYARFESSYVLEPSSLLPEVRTYACHLVRVEGLDPRWVFAKTNLHSRMTDTDLPFRPPLSRGFPNILKGEVIRTLQ